jgi:dihydropteroate synthase
MGVMNVTPDSFSDGGRLEGVEGAVAHGLALDRAGADILDIGGESTRPGARPVNAEDEAGRVLPVIRTLRPLTPRRISIDTCKPEVARGAMEAGADIWNDVTALATPGAADLAAELGCEVVLMHMQGEPRTMQAAPQYEDVLAEVCAFLEARAEAALAAGVARERIWLDPGIGFGKNTRGEGFNLDVTLRVSDHGLDRAVIDDLIQKAHQVCPYSNATRGNVDEP